jgi:hypothetical protein
MRAVESLCPEALFPPSEAMERKLSLATISWLIGTVQRPIAKHRHQLVKTSFGSIRLLDYGAVWKPSPEWTKQQEVKAAEAKAEAAKAIQAKQASAESAGLRYNRSQADKGDMQGLFRMGQRYASGDGVDKDPAKARAFFQSALSAGHPDAAKALAAVQD